MKPPEFYRGREQTYVKHLFLEEYLERVAYNIGSFATDFVYVDGFSGPWKSQDEDYADTSFGLAILKLRQVRNALTDQGKRFDVRCLFIEKDPSRYAALKTETQKIPDMAVNAEHGEFEALIPRIIEFVGKSFALVFVDPTGWTGFGLAQIRPLLILRGEVIVNFMYNDINRHLEDPRPEVIRTLDSTFGGHGWQREIEERIADGMNREDAVVETYRRRFKAAGNFPYATTTRVLNPLADRTYFYLVYGTRHRKGLIEFRNVEKKVIDIQENVRDAAKYDYRVSRTSQGELFGPGEFRSPSRHFQEERSRECNASRSELRADLAAKGVVKYEDILPIALEHRLVWESDVKQWLMDMSGNGDVEIRGLKPRERTPKPGHVICWLGGRSRG